MNFVQEHALKAQHHWRRLEKEAANDKSESLTVVQQLRQDLSASGQKLHAEVQRADTAVEQLQQQQEAYQALVTTRSKSHKDLEDAVKVLKTCPTDRSKLLSCNLTPCVRDLLCRKQYSESQFAACSLLVQRHAAITQLSMWAAHAANVGFTASNIAAQRSHAQEVHEMSPAWCQNF